MSEQVTGTLGIELGADNAIRDAGVLKQSLNQVVTAEDAVVAASKAMTEAFKAQAAAARAEAAEARKQESARREATNAAKAGAAAIAKAASDEARAAKEGANALAAKARAEEQSAKAAAQSAAAEKRATDALSQRTRAMALQESEAYKLNAAFDKQQQSATSLLGTYGQLTAAAIGFKALQYAREAIQLADAYTNIESKLGLVSNGTAGLARTTNDLFQLSQDTRTELSANAALYTSLYRSTRTLGTSQEDLLKVNKAVAQSFLINGSATSESAAATRQLGQALASGVLRGDEFNSISENAPRIQQAVAESLHVTIGELREMAAQGKLTGEVVVKSLLDASKSIDTEARKIAPTWEGASKQAGNAILLLIGRINEAAGFTRGLAGDVKSFADYAATLANDDALLDYWRNIGLGSKLLSTTLADTKDGLLSVASLLGGGFKGALAVGSGNLSEFERIAAAVNKTMSALRGTYDDTAKLFAKPVQKSVFGASDFGSNPKALTGPITTPPTKEEIEARKKLNEQYDKTFANASRELAKQVELRAAYVLGARAIEDVVDAFALKNKLAAIDEKLSATQKARLTEVIVGEYSQLEALKLLKRADEDYAVAVEHSLGVIAAWKEGYDKRIASAKAGADAVKKDAEAQAFELSIIGQTGLALQNMIDTRTLLAKALEYEASGLDKVAARKAADVYVTNEQTKRHLELVDAAKKYTRELNGQNPFSIPSGKGALTDDASKALDLVDKIGSSLVDSGSKFARILNSSVNGLRGIIDGVQAAGSLNKTSSKLDVASVGAGIFSAGYGIIDAWASSSKEQARAAHEAATALRELRVAVKESVAQYSVQANGSELEQTLYTLEQNYKAIYRNLIAAGGVDPNAAKRTAVSIVPTAEDFAKAAAAYEKLVQAAKDAANKAAAEVAAAAAKAIADEIRRVDRSLFDIGNEARSYSDPRGAGAAAFEESWRRRIEDAATPIERLALEAGKTAATIARLGEIAAADANETRSYLSRIFTANGNTRGAEDASRLNAQLEERRNTTGSTPFNQLLRDRSQYLENSAVLRDRNITDGTKRLTEEANAQLKGIDKLLSDAKAIADKRVSELANYAADEKELNAAFNRAKDEEIKGIEDSAKLRLAALGREATYARDAEQYAQKQISLIQQEVDARRQAVESLKAYTDSLKLSDLSTLSPVDKATEARKQFDAVSGKALSGDAASVSATIAAANALLQAKRTTDASGTGFAAEYDNVQRVISALKGQFGESLVSSEAALGKAVTAADLATQTLASIEAERTAIQSATTKQVDAINLLREEGNAASAKLLESWQKESDAVSQKYADFADAQSKAKDAITEKLGDAISTLISNENAAYEERASFADWRERLYAQQEEATAYLARLAGDERSFNVPSSPQYSASGTMMGDYFATNPASFNAPAQPAPVSQGESQLISEVQALKSVVAKLDERLVKLLEGTAATVDAVNAQSGVLKAAGAQIAEEIQDTGNLIRFKLDRSPTNS